MLRYTIDKLTDVNESERALYKESNGKLILDIEPHPDASRISEFRDSNRALNTKVADLETKLKVFDGIDPVAAKAALAGDPATVAKLAKLSDTEAALAAERDAHAATKFRNTVAAEFLAAGGRPAAVEMMVTKAAKTFAVDGTTKAFSAEKPGEPLTLSEFMLGQIASPESSFLFETSAGGGAARGTGIAGPPARRQVNRNDPLDFGRSLVEIASGDAEVG